MDVISNNPQRRAPKCCKRSRFPSPEEFRSSKPKLNSDSSSTDEIVETTEDFESVFTKCFHNGCTKELFADMKQLLHLLIKMKARIGLDSSIVIGGGCSFSYEASDQKLRLEDYLYNCSQCDEDHPAFRLLLPSFHESGPGSFLGCIDPCI